MAVPKKKTSKSRRGMRCSHHAISPINLVVDPVTGDYKLPHHINPITGTYKVKVVKDAKGKRTHEAVKFINIKQKFDNV